MLFRSLVQGGQLVGTWTARWAAAGEDEAGLAGNHLAGPRLSAELGGAGAAVLWFSDGAREAWRAGTRADTADWFRAAGLELVDRSSAETPSSGFGKTNANFEELTRLARAAAHQHNLSLLRRLTEAAGPDLEVRASWDPVRALPYVSVVARTTKGVRESRSWAVAGDGRLVTLGARAGADEIRAALGWAPADVIFEPEQLR